MLPVAVFFSIWSYEVSQRRIMIEFAFGLIFSLYIVIIAILSPCPPFLNHWLGEAFIVLSWILAECIFTRVKCLIATRLERFGQKVLYYLGLVTLLGQVIGGISIYLLVDIFRLFKHKPDCIFDLSYCKL